MTADESYPSITELDDYAKAREDVAYFMRRLYRQGLTTTSGGNISCRLPGDLMAITASKCDKGEQLPSEVGVVPLVDGHQLTEGLTLSIETHLHAAIYCARPDVHAIVHAHPVTATAYCTLPQDINTHLTAEAYTLLGDPVRIPYALMGTPELARRVAECLRPPAVCGLMENHGVIAVGSTLLAAFDRLELLEVAARQTALVTLLGHHHDLSSEWLPPLDRLGGR